MRPPACNALAATRLEGQQCSAGQPLLGALQQPPYVPPPVPSLHTHAGLALQNGTHVLVQQGLALLIARRRATYVRFRELWVLAATVHLVWVALNSGERLAAHGCPWTCPRHALWKRCQQR